MRTSSLKPIHWLHLLAILFACGAILAAQAGPPTGAQPGEKIIWAGRGEDDKWSTVANWQPARVPGAADDVVIDGTSAKNSRWDGAQHIASLTVTPAYQGQLILAGHGAIEGDVVLNGRAHSNRDMHQWLWMRGRRVDLSGVTEWTQVHRYSGGIDLGGSDEKLVQTFTAPKMRIGDLRLPADGVGNRRMKNLLPRQWDGRHPGWVGRVCPSAPRTTPGQPDGALGTDAPYPCGLGPSVFW